MIPKKYVYIYPCIHGYNFTNVHASGGLRVADSLFNYMKNIGEGGQILCLQNEKQQAEASCFLNLTH